MQRDLVRTLSSRSGYALIPRKHEGAFSDGGPGCRLTVVPSGA